MALSPEEITALLKAEQLKATGVKSSTDAPSKFPRPMQLGPLTWHDETMRCSSRGCSSPTLIRVRKIPHCTTHALNELNRIILLELENIELDKCTCNAGMHSKGNIHTYECVLFTEINPKSPHELGIAVDL